MILLNRTKKTAKTTKENSVAPAPTSTPTLIAVHGQPMPPQFFEAMKTRYQVKQKRAQKAKENFAKGYRERKAKEKKMEEQRKENLANWKASRQTFGKERASRSVRPQTRKGTSINSGPSAEQRKGVIRKRDVVYRNKSQSERT